MKTYKRLGTALALGALGGLSLVLICPRADARPSAPAAATQVIANWDVVPFQVFTDTFKVGVVAFHESGADVVFAVNGGTPVTVTAPTYNDRTDVYEYWIELNAGDYADGAITVSAIAYPDDPASFSRTLSDLTLYADAGGSVTNTTARYANCNTGSDTTGDGSEGNPFRTMEAAYNDVGEGGTVYLQAGTCYSVMSQYGHSGYGGTYWTTVSAAPGVSRDEVAILGGSMYEDMVRWHNVQLYSDSSGGVYSTILYLGGASHVWLDGVEMYNTNGHWTNCQVLNQQSAAAYFTDSEIRDVMNVLGRTNFARNVSVQNVGADVIRGTNDQVVIDLRVDNMDPAPGAHADLIQWYNPGLAVENGIYYNIKVTDMNCQGIFGGGDDSLPVRDIALVNFVMEKPNTGPGYSQLGYMDHVLMWHFTTVDALISLRSEAEVQGTLTAFDVENNIFFTFHAGSILTLTDSLIAHNHYEELNWNQSTGMGEDFTVGDPEYSYAGDGNYYLQEHSPGTHAGVPLECVPADIDGRLYHATTPSLGAFAFVPTLDLHGSPRDRAIDLSWEVNFALPATTTWQIDYYSETLPSLVLTETGLLSPTRAYTLTGLTNYEWYTVTLHAMVDSTSFLSDTARVMPTDIFVYLPLVAREE